jgi:hypothetical protein
MTPDRFPVLRQRLLWIDGIGAVIVGVGMLALSPWLEGFFGFSRSFVLLLGAVNLAYGSFSLPLARRAVRPLWRIRLLASANVAWGGVCLVLIALHWGTATVFGLLHLGLEGAYVAGLGALEWRWREALRTR